MRTLRDTGQLDKTVIAFTSDNGYLMGEHRKVSKNQPFPHGLLVPASG